MPDWHLHRANSAVNLPLEAREFPIEPIYAA